MTNLAIRFTAFVLLFAAFSKGALAVDRPPLSPPCFGNSIAVHGDLVLVGAPNAYGKGRAYLYRREGAAHRLLKVIEPTSLFGKHNFGEDVALDRRTVIVGDGSAYSGFTSGAGATFVFDMPKVGEPADKPLKLAPTKPERLAGFGDAVAFHGNLLAIGEYARYDGGSVTIFRRKDDNAWSRVSTLNATQLDGPSVSVEWFGVRIALTESTLVVGAPWTKTDDVRLGAAFLYQMADNGQLAGAPTMLSWQDRRKGDFFGSEVASEKDIIVVSAGLTASGGEEDSGAVCVYLRGRDGRFAVEPTTVLTSAKPQKEEHFGSSVAIADRRIVVGASGEHGVYVFEPMIGDDTKWTQVAHLTGSAPPADFGAWGIAATESLIYVGEPYSIPYGEHNGQVAVFAREEKNDKITFRRIETIGMPE